MTPPAEVAAVFAALADGTRLQMIDALQREGEASASALAAGLPVSRQAIVKHLGVLDRAGLVSSNKVGREVRFALCPKPASAAAHWLDAAAARWDRRLEIIKTIAENPEDRES